MPICDYLSQRLDWILRIDRAHTSKLYLISPMPTHPWKAEDGKEEKCVVIGYGWVALD